MEAIRILMVVVLLVIWGLVGWILTHLRKVKRELRENDAMPGEVPGRNLLIGLAIFLTTVSVLLLYEIF